MGTAICAKHTTLKCAGGKAEHKKKNCNSKILPRVALTGNDECLTMGNVFTRGKPLYLLVRSCTQLMWIGGNLCLNANI